MQKKLKIIGAGLAGCEAAWQAAKRGVKVRLIEMKPLKKSPAHKSGDFAELVCSNSLRSASLENAVGLLKEEMRAFDSLIMRCADACRVPAGGALAVDRAAFAGMVTAEIKKNPNIEIINAEITGLNKDDGIVIVATGPLTTDQLSASIAEAAGKKQLYFYDAAAPIVTAESIDMTKIFRASRYGKGDGDDYLNCPMTKEEYERFMDELIKAEREELKDFEPRKIFEGCMPIEIMAARGRDTIRFGPLKPVGLKDPATGKMPYAVVQLRTENAEGTLYNLVGFQTNLKFKEQKRVFSLIPGLAEAEFVRYGVMHRNTFIKSPGLIGPDYALKSDPDLYFAGQITGVEGYVESAASGLVAGLNAALKIKGAARAIFPKTTAMGALAHYISGAQTGDFQPMNVNFGIMSQEGLENIRNKRDKASAMSARALETIRAMALQYRS